MRYLPNLPRAFPFLIPGAILALLLLPAGPLPAQNASKPAPTPAQPAAQTSAQAGPPTSPAVLATIHRLILKDGSDQTVRQLQIKGGKVRYISAERAGEWEELPVELVDWPATEKYAREHVPGAAPAASPAQDDAAALDKEALAERAEMNARTPEVMPGLRLPDRDGVWALDYFRDQPELVTLEQNSGDVNHQTGHNVLRATLNPLGGTKQQVRLDGAKSKVRLHENDPALYISLTTPGEQEPGPEAMKVDTHGMKAPDAVSSPHSQYIIVRVEPKRDYRVVSNIHLNALGHMSQSQDVVETTSTILPGGHWMKVVPKEKLTIDEYALVEVLGPKDVNLSVWDFRVDPTSAENPNSILPLQRSR